MVEVLVLRGAPGLINVCGLLMLAGWLEVGEYGFFSTTLATCAMVANLAGGPFSHAIVPRHSAFAQAGRVSEFDSTLTFLAITIATTLAIAGIVSNHFGLIEFHYVALVIFMSIFSIFQPILNARLWLWRYGAAALVQALALIILLWVLVRPAPLVSNALWAYAGSYAAGVAASFILVGAPCPRVPEYAMLIRTLQVGVPLTLSNLAENGLQLGFRYTLLIFGAATTLGVFSLSLDMAQRVVGVVINMTSFALVPRAYRANALGEPIVSLRLLKSGALASGFAATGMMLLVLGAQSTGLIPALNSQVFLPWAFVVISLAVIMNRIKKLIIDPLLICADQTAAILLGYVAAIPVAISLAALSLLWQFEPGVYFAYLIGYLVVVVVSVGLHFHGTRRLIGIR